MKLMSQRPDFASGIYPFASPQLAELLRCIDEPLRKVEELLFESIQSPVKSITDIAAHLLSAGGKRLRPALTLLCAQAAGEVNQRAVVFATVVELMHTATLIHDDVIDDADLRRGRPAANRLWGNEAVVMCGDYLYSKAFSMLAEDGDIEIIRIFTEASAKMCAGEILELQKSYKPDLTEEEYEEIVRLKTAELIRAACKAGALAGGASKEVAEALGNYGLHVGIAFQIIDDLLDIYGDAGRLGKPVGSDLTEGKLTLPVIRTLSTVPQKDRQTFSSMIAGGRITPELVKAVAVLVPRGDAVAYTLEVAYRYVSLALESLRSLARTPALQTLELAADFVVNRQF